LGDHCGIGRYAAAQPGSEWFGSSGIFQFIAKLDGKNDLGTGSVWIKATQNFGAEFPQVAQGWIRNEKYFRASGAAIASSPSVE
jgi:hypothetical protein